MPRYRAASPSTAGTSDAIPSIRRWCSCRTRELRLIQELRAIRSHRLCRNLLEQFAVTDIPIRDLGALEQQHGPVGLHRRDLLAGPRERRIGEGRDVVERLAD